VSRTLIIAFSSVDHLNLIMLIMNEFASTFNEKIGRTEAGSIEMDETKNGSRAGLG
jgi:hypothetical protein